MPRRYDGFTLIESLVAMGLVVTVALGSAQLFSVAIARNLHAREQLVMSLVTNIGPKPNVMEEAPESCRRIKVQQPILTNSDLEKIREIADPHFKSKTLRMLFRVAD